MKNIIFFIALTTLSFSCIAQTKKKTSSKKYICTTFVYNLTTGNMRMKDLCFDVVKTDHIDMNEFNPGREYDKTKDFWKFSITIMDNEKKSKQSLNASFYVYEESAEIKQYHSIVEDSDFKAIIFDKIHNSWQILMLQNEEYKILSSYTGYHYTNAFGIKQKQKSNNIDY
jgi:hypothetical protein